MKNLVPRLAALSLAAVSISCSQGTSTPSSSALGLGSVATVNGKSIPESVFRVHTLNATKKNADDLTAEEHRAVLDDLIGIVVMAEEAENQGLLAERTIAAQMELSRLQLAARAMATRFLEKNPAGGIHHVCYEVDDIIAARDRMQKEGARVLGDGEPKIGAHGKPVLFLHPKDFLGTLVELEQA